MVLLFRHELMLKKLPLSTHNTCFHEFNNLDKLLSKYMEIIGIILPQGSPFGITRQADFL